MFLVTEAAGVFGVAAYMKPSYDFHFEGLSNFSPSVEKLVQIQDVNPRIYK